MSYKRTTKQPFNVSENGNKNGKIETEKWWKISLEISFLYYSLGTRALEGGFQQPLIVPWGCNVKRAWSMPKATNSLNTENSEI